MENAQLLRQAQNSTKRIKKQVETDSSNKSQKQPAHTPVKSTSVVIRSRKLPSRLKPQLRQTPLSVSSVKASSSSVVSLLPPKIVEEPATITASEDVSEIKPQQIKKRQRDDESTYSSSSSNLTLSPNTNKETETATAHVNKRKRNYTANSNHPSSSSTSAVTIATLHNNEEVHRQQTIHRHRYNSHQPTTDGLDSIITPVQSRHNSITPLSDQMPLSFDNDNETLIVPTQFDITTSPFGTEQYYNTYDSFEHVSSIPALRTPMGRRSNTNHHNETTLLSQAQHQPPPYEPTSLDILNSIMQEHHQDLETTG